MATDLFSTYARDSRLENEGAPWVRRIFKDDDCNDREETYHLARLHERANKAWGKAMREHRRWVAEKNPSDAEAERALMERFVLHILKGWKDLYIPFPIPGKQGFLPYSPQNAMWLLTTLPDFYDELWSRAQQGALFQDEQYMGESQRSPSTSDGNSSSVSAA